MKPLQRFWQAIESIPGAAAVRAEWQRQLGSDFNLVATLLRPTDELAACFPALDDPAALPYTVVPHGPDDFVGVAANGGATITLSKADLLIYRLDHRRLHVSIATTLGVELSEARVDGAPFTSRIATYRPFAGFCIPVYLVLPLESADLLHGVQGISSQCDEPFILLAPTARRLRPPCEALLKARKACFLALDEAITIGGPNKWTSTPEARQRLEAFRDAVIPQATKQDGTVFFPTPANVSWADVRIKFIDGHTVSVKAGTAARTFVYAQMGMADRRHARPTKQWELLRAFAESYGTLTWKSRAADRRNQKRRERLAQDLKKFFRIDGEPILPTDDAKGWRTVFQLEPDN
ncbi:MAG: hypothetical protein KatS3mg082_2567 [Nitrospiraceae bacterium]|nr:MAG: hypothetical protein KatS3mg082_2567 [Nitrospiraceae bacterium]